MPCNKTEVELHAWMFPSAYASWVIVPKSPTIMNCWIQTHWTTLNCLKHTLIIVRKSVLVRPKLTSFIIRYMSWLWQDFSKYWTAQLSVFKVSVYQCECYFKSTGAVYNRHTFVTLEVSWQLAGQCIQDLFHSSDLTGPFDSFDLPVHFEVLSCLPSVTIWTEFLHFLLPFLHFSLILFLFPALWLGNLPKFGLQPHVVLLFVHSLLAHFSNSFICTKIIPATSSSQH